MSLLLTMGTFDLPHAGHVIFLRRCERYADHVLVGLNTDRFVREYKGAAPVLAYGIRKQIIEKLGYAVVANDGPGRVLIESASPDIVAIGTDWAKKDYHAQIDTPIEYFEEHGIAMLYLPYTEGISSSIISASLR